jgi:hypothetical protein
MKRFGLILAMALTACTGAEQQPEKKWDVKVTTKGEAKVWVFQSDGSKQCAEAPPSLTPSGASKDLMNLGVMVYQGRTGNDGMMRTAVCGSPTGNTVELEIGRVDLPKAEAKGYRLKRRQ